MTFVFDWFSILFAIIIIFYLIMGIAKGAGYIIFNVFLAFVILLASLITARFLGPFVGTVTGLRGFFTDGVIDTLEKMNSLFSTSNPGRDLVAGAIKSNNYAALEGAGIPALIGPLLLAILLPNIPVEATSTPVSAYAAEAILNAIFTFVAFLIVYIVLSVIYEVFKSKARKKQKKEREEGIYKKPNALSRIVGAAFGAFAGFVMVFFILWIFRITLLQVTNLRVFFAFIWKLDEPGVMTIGKWLYTNNPFSNVLLWVFRLFNI